MHLKASMPRDDGGWRVAPAPDGRGMPEQHRPRAAAPSPQVLALLRRRCWRSTGSRSCSSSTAGQPRVKVPFSPYFLDQVQAGQVKSITSKGDTIKGTFTSHAALSAKRGQGDADDALLNPGAVVLEQRSADEPAPTPRASRSTPSRPQPGRRRCWARSCSASVRRCCSSDCSCCSPAALKLLPEDWEGWVISDVRRRGGSIRRRSGSRSTMSPGSMRPRPS